MAYVTSLPIDYRYRVQMNLKASLAHKMDNSETQTKFHYISRSQCTQMDAVDLTGIWLQYMTE